MLGNVNKIVQKICKNCNVLKDIEQFNKKLNAVNNTRKNICADCESLNRKANKHKLTTEIVIDMQNCLCPICQTDKATMIHTDPTGILCRACYNRYVVIANPVLVQQVINYQVMLRDFPFTKPYLFRKIDNGQMEFQF